MAESENNKVTQFHVTICQRLKEHDVYYSIARFPCVEMHFSVLLNS